MKTFKVKQVRSAIGRPQRQKDTLKSLGFRKLNQVVELNDTPQLRGMVAKIEHLVQIEG